MKLTAAARKKIPKKDFALGAGRYPIEDQSHARNALARVSQHGTPAEKEKVRAAVHRKYPGMGGKKKGMGHNGPHAHVDGATGIHHGAHEPHSAICSQKGTDCK